LYCLSSGLYYIIPGAFQDDELQQTKQNIIQVINKHGWKYKQHIVQLEIDVTEVFDELSVTGNLLLDFLMQTLNFRATASESKVQEVLDLINKSSATVSDKRLLPYTNYIIFILKN